MKKTIVMSSTPSQAENRPEHLAPKTEREPVGYHVAAALASGAFLTICLASLSILTAYLVTPIAKFLPLLLAGSLTAGFVLMARKGIAWIDEDVTRPWRMQDRALEPWALDETDEEEVLPLESGANLTPDRISLVGFLILDWHFRLGMACTRPECKEQDIKQAEWNAVNQALTALGIKSARGWIESDYGQAIEAWLNNIQIEPDLTAIIRKDPRTNNWKRIKLA